MHNHRRIMIGAAALAALATIPGAGVEAHAVDDVGAAKLAEEAAARRKMEREERAARERRAAHERKYGPGRYMPHQGAKEMARRAKRKDTPNA